jgi:hypothetical protein
MRICIRFIGLAALTLFATVLMALSSTTSSLYALVAATYMLPGSFATPFGSQAKTDLAKLYVTATTGVEPTLPLFERNWPVLPDSPDSIEQGSTIFGYSIGAYAASEYKLNFSKHWADDPDDAPDLTFVVIANTRRPNGGLSSRWGVPSTPTETAGAPAGDITTFDVVRQYDGGADYPTNPLNPLAYANASMGLWSVHLDYGSVDMDDALPQGTYGDTEYYLIPTRLLPLLMPVNSIPGIGPMLADAMDPVLRVLVEAGYDRTGNPGEPTPFNFMYSPDPLTLSQNLQLAIKVGQDNWSEDMGMGRPLGTVRPGPYGVGGPPVLTQSTADRQSIKALSAPVTVPEGLSETPPASPPESPQVVAPPAQTPGTSAAPSAPVAATHVPSTVGGGDEVDLSTTRHRTEWNTLTRNTIQTSADRFVKKAVQDLRHAFTPRSNPAAHHESDKVADDSPSGTQPAKDQKPEGKTDQ